MVVVIQQGLQSDSKKPVIWTRLTGLVSRAPSVHSMRVSTSADKLRQLGPQNQGKSGRVQAKQQHKEVRACTLASV